MALVVGRYEGLFTLISPYNKGHTCIKEQPEADRQWSKENGITTNYDLQNTPQKTKIEQHEPHYNPAINAGAPEG